MKWYLRVVMYAWGWTIYLGGFSTLNWAVAAVASCCWALGGPHLQRLLPGLKEMSGWTLMHITCRCVQLMWAGCESARVRAFCGWSCRQPGQNDHFSSARIIIFFFCSERSVSHLTFQGRVISTGYCTSKKCQACLVTVKLFGRLCFTWSESSPVMAWLLPLAECTLNF